MDATAPGSNRPRSLGQKLARLGRFIAFLCTAGWLFPHVCTEGMDLSKIQRDQLAKKP